MHALYTWSCVCAISGCCEVVFLISDRPICLFFDVVTHRQLGGIMILFNNLHSWLEISLGCSGHIKGRVLRKFMI